VGFAGAEGAVAIYTVKTSDRGPSPFILDAEIYMFTNEPVDWPDNVYDLMKPSVIETLVYDPVWPTS